MKVAKERKSAILASNAVHHRVDSLTSIVALVAIGGSHIIEGATWLDPVGGLLVALMVIQAGFSNTISSIYELCDRAIDEDVRDKVSRVVSKTVESRDIDVRHVEGIKAGQNFLLDIELGVPSDATVAFTRDIEHTVRERIGAGVRGARRVRIRFVPRDQESGDFKDEFIAPDVSPRESPEPEANGHGHNHEHDHKNTAANSSSIETSKAERRR